MQSYIDSAYRGRAVAAEEPLERIKRRRRIAIQQRFPQPGLTNNATKEILLLVPRITKT